jgi:hypothetical protein
VDEVCRTRLAQAILSAMQPRATKQKSADPDGIGHC